MTRVNDPDLFPLRLALADHLAEIQKLFKPGNRVTLVVRNPGVSDEAGLVIGDDDLDEAVAEIRRRQGRTV